jgi:2-hydroxychromene-2-carboxylate isomerase
VRIPDSDPSYDIEFFWDPVCPYSWITSRWIEQVARQRDYRVDWRFISLRLLNRPVDELDVVGDHDHGHTAGLRMLRVAAAVRNELGREPLGAFVSAFGHSFWDRPKGSGMRAYLSTTAHATEVLEAAGLPTRFADALDDSGWDALLDAETELALSRTGRDVGTPIISFRPPDGQSLFGFSEMKRSAREVPQLTILGAAGPSPAAS